MFWEPPLFYILFLLNEMTHGSCVLFEEKKEQTGNWMAQYQKIKKFNCQPQISTVYLLIGSLVFWEKVILY